MRERDSALPPGIWNIVLGASARRAISGATGLASHLPLPPITGTTIGGQHRLFAYVYTSSTNPSLTLISFTGSEYLDEWELDFDFAQTEPTYLSNYTSGVMCQWVLFDLSVAEDSVVIEN